MGFWLDLRREQNQHHLDQHAPQSEEEGQEEFFCARPSFFQVLLAWGMPF